MLSGPLSCRRRTQPPRVACAQNIHQPARGFEFFQPGYGINNFIDVGNGKAGFGIGPEFIFDLSARERVLGGSPGVVKNHSFTCR